MEPKEAFVGMEVSPYTKALPSRRVAYIDEGLMVLVTKGFSVVPYEWYSQTEAWVEYGDAHNPERITTSDGSPVIPPSKVSDRLEKLEALVVAAEEFRDIANKHITSNCDIQRQMRWSADKALEHALAALKEE